LSSYSLLHPSPWSHMCQSPPIPRQDLFCFPALWFCRRKKIKKGKEKHDVLLIWDKDSHTQSFFVMFPFIYTNVYIHRHLYTFVYIYYNPN
jgi:hypothetical protein